MHATASPKIVAVERLSEGIVVKFADGSCAFYSAHLLFATVPQAETQNEKAASW